jgi:hypothetical protein
MKSRKIMIFKFSNPMIRSHLLVHWARLKKKKMRVRRMKKIITIKPKKGNK